MLEYINVTKYRGKEKILDGVRLAVPNGVILGLSGPDHAAQSALLRLGAGCETPDAGSIRIQDKRITPESPAGGREIYVEVGYMPERYGFHDFLRVDEYYEFFLSLYHMTARYREKRINDVLELLNMEQYQGTFLADIPAELKPLLYLGKTILHEPAWLFLEEPFTGVKGNARNEMVRVLLALKEQGYSMVIAGAPAPELTGLCTHLALLKDGKPVVFGEKDAIYEQAMSNCPIRMHVLSGMEKALAVLKENPLVERVTVDGEEVIFRFNAGEEEEGRLLYDIVSSGALIHNYMRDRMQFFSVGEDRI